MAKPVTPQEMFDLWQKMVNPGAYPLQSLMFPVLDAAELDKKVRELEAVQHWLKANLNMLQLTIQSLEYQRSLLAGGEKAAAAMAGDSGRSGASGVEANPAMWAWNMMAQAGKSAVDAAAAAPPAKKARPRRSKKS